MKTIMALTAGAVLATGLMLSGQPDPLTTGSVGRESRLPAVTQQNAIGTSGESYRLDRP